MKEKVIIIVILTILLWILLFPKRVDIEPMSYEAVAIPFFEVHVDGAVYFPKTVKMYEPITMGDLLSNHIYLQPDADLTKINLYQVIQATTTLYIPFYDEKEPIRPTQVNINTADFQTLITIPGMQERIAAGIIIYREANGPFVHLEELLNVKYIGVATLEKLAPYLSLQ